MAVEGLKEHTCIPATSVFDGTITNWLSTLRILIKNHFTCSCAGRKKKTMIQIWHFYWSFSEWRCGKHGSERVNRGRDSSVGRAPHRKTRHNTAAGSIPTCAARNLSPRVNFHVIDSHTVFVELACAIAFINICAHVKKEKKKREKKVTNTGSHNFDRTLENTLHTDRNG